MGKTQDDLSGKAARIALQRLESLERAGVMHLPKGRRAAAKVAATPVIPEPPHPGPLPRGGEGEKVAAAARSAEATGVSAAKSLFGSNESNAIPAADRPGALKVIQDEVVACTRCKVLAEGRTQTVFGVGSPNARIVFFGEAPGADEDRLGEPFVGRAGQLLDKMIVACKMKREDVYILNVLKCRPPGNRNPLPDEVENCRAFFERQLEVIRPEIICCLGAVAAQSLLNTDRSIGKLRGRFHDYGGIPVVCTYHPAYLLRNPAAKHDAWEDLKLMMRTLGVEL